MCSIPWGEGGSVLWGVFSTVGDVMSTVGGYLEDILSTVGDVQYRGDKMINVGIS